MAIRILILCLLFVASTAWADAVKWEYDTTKGLIPSTVLLKKGANSNGPWTTVATIPAQPATYTFPYPPDNQWYVIDSAGALTNSLNYYPLTVAYDDTALKKALADLDAKLTSAIQALDGRLDTLELLPNPPAPTPTSKVLIKTLSETQIEVTCLDGTRPTQQLDATGLKRHVTCP